MIRVIFKNLEKSELARDLVLERVASVVERFPVLESHKISVTLSMENSPVQAGPDEFTVKLFIQGSTYRSVTLEKSATSLYVALADVVEHSLELLNRHSDRERVVQRVKARKFRVPTQTKVEKEPSDELLWEE
jgi:hypothetical protein